MASPPLRELAAQCYEQQLEEEAEEHREWRKKRIREVRAAFRRITGREPDYADADRAAADGVVLRCIHEYGYSTLHLEAACPDCGQLTWGGVEIHSLADLGKALEEPFQTTHRHHCRTGSIAPKTQTLEERQVEALEEIAESLAALALRTVGG